MPALSPCCLQRGSIPWAKQEWCCLLLSRAVAVPSGLEYPNPLAGDVPGSA